MIKKITGKYYVKNTADDTFRDVTTLFDGVNILSVTGMDARGKALNVFRQQWVDDVTQTEDFMIVMPDTQDTPHIIRENPTIDITYIISPRYAGDGDIDTQAVYDTFTSYMTDTDVWIASTYTGKQVHCVSIDTLEPKTVRLQRGTNSYILGMLTLQALAKTAPFTPTTP